MLYGVSPVVLGPCALLLRVLSALEPRPEVLEQVYSISGE